jgi:23S rRNA pseudouridine1911/1915/1917 synthase
MSRPPKGRLRWVVRSGDGRVVGEVLVRAAVDAGAVADGRVFVGRRRVIRADEEVCDGDVIEVASPREDLGLVAILLDGGDVVAVDKPAGIPTIADHGGAAHALVARVARTLGVDPSDLHPTSRLDRDVSGVVVFARTRAAAERLRVARAEGTYARRYVGIATGVPDPASGRWDSPIGRAPRDPRLRAVGGRDPVPAATRYASCGRAPHGAALLAVSPVTGRTHQIRVHAAHAGSPLVGDRAYGGPTRLVLPNGRVQEPGRIALHALRVTVPNATGEALVAVAPVPAALRDLWSALGGTPEAWELAASWDFAPP